MVIRSMKQAEAEGKSLKEALLRASEELGVPVASIRYEVLDQRRRFLGIIGRQSVRIRAWTEAAEAGVCQVFLEGLLRLARIRCRVGVSRQDGQGLVMELEGDDLGLLLRRDGELLDALQHITEKASRKEGTRGVRLLLDAGGFRSRREGELRKSALRAAREALRHGSASVGPLNARERRIVHLCLKESPGVTTRSVGKGPLRRVLVTREPSTNHPGEVREAP